MDDYEIELIDYLRVMWWGKWIILGCLAVAIGLSALYLVLRPATYSGSTTFMVREYVTAAVAGDQGATVSLDAVLASALMGVERAVPGMDVSRTEDRIALTQSRGISRDAIHDALTRAESVLNEQLPVALAEELGHVATELRFQEKSLMAQLEILRQRLAEERTSGNLPVSESLAERIAILEAELARLQVRLSTLETAKPEDFFMLRPIGEPTITVSQPNGKTTIAIGGLLGLMIGVLLAFFVHYLLQVHAREQRASKGKEAGSD